MDEKYALIKANPRYAEGVYSSDVFSNGEKIIKNKNKISLYNDNEKIYK